ncbi:MAG: G-D-S-L family lipolytic protein [Aestuariibaculum sp.]
MKKKIINSKYVWLAVMVIAFSACNDEEDIEKDFGIYEEEAILPELIVGEADFSNYIAVGASFSAGYTDNALFIKGQENSFPNILAQQFALVGGGTFNQPLMGDNIGGFLVGGTVEAAPRLYFNTETSTPTVLQQTPTTEITTSVLADYGGAINNYGVPGLKSFHLGVAGYGTLNPYFGRMASGTSAMVLSDAVAQNPTFFTLSEIGGNDVLGFALAGGDGTDQTGNIDPSTYGSSDITDPNVFAASFSAAVNALTANGAKGVVTNVPYITSLAHFTTVPYNPIPLDEATATVVNQAYAQYNGGLQLALNNGLISSDEASARTIAFEASETNAVVIEDESLTDLSGLGLPNYRQATEQDLLVLPASSFIGTEAVPGNPLTVNGVAVPLADKWVLVPAEQEAIKTATDSYNQTIKTIAEAKNLALVDFKTLLLKASSPAGLSDGNYILSTSLATGGLISLDGVHLTSRGYAALANQMLKAIDATYGTNFEASGNLVDIGSYPTNYSPTLQ